MSQVHGHVCGCTSQCVMKSDEQLIICLWGECKAGMHLKNINSIHSTHVQACVKQHLTVRARC